MRFKSGDLVLVQLSAVRPSDAELAFDVGIIVEEVSHESPLGNGPSSEAAVRFYSVLIEGKICVLPNLVIEPLPDFV